MVKHRKKSTRTSGNQPIRNRIKSIGWIFDPLFYLDRTTGNAKEIETFEVNGGHRVAAKTEPSKL